MSTEGLGKVYGDGDVVVRQGEIGDCMFAIQQGRVEGMSDAMPGGPMMHQDGMQGMEHPAKP